MELVYDGSFDGLLCALAHACSCAEVERLTSVANAQPTLFGTSQPVPTNPSCAAAFARRLRANTSRAVLRNVLYNFLSELPGFEQMLLPYVRLAHIHGATVDCYHTHAAVRAVHALTRKVGCELHRLTGLLRFRELKDGTWWAPIAPDHNVACGLAVHFRRRMPASTWVIYDVRRSYGVRWDTRSFILVTVPDEWRSAVARDADAVAAWYAESEKYYQRLWQGYFTSISITVRTNPALQRRFMPQRYWPYLVERPTATLHRQPAKP
ncbi:MAG: TIGR03915 family putative DNA repair protein [bacterium]|nr:TIGR03915 family putative DNA repair protein [bacterium]